MRILRTIGMLGALLGVAACNLDQKNPNAPTGQTVLHTREGIVALAVGMQARYASGMSMFIAPSGTIADEIGAPAGSQQSWKDAEQGTLEDTYQPVTDPWSTHYATIKSANDLLANAQNVDLGDSTLSGVMSLAYLIKAMSLGDLLQLYPQIAVTTYNVAHPTFVSRTVALDTVLALLDSSLAWYRSGPPGSEFANSIVAKGFDLKNTIFAMQARYERLAGNWAAAMTASDSVSRTVVSVEPFSQTVFNPMYDLTYRAAYVEPRDSFRLSADAGDQRVPFFVIDDSSLTGNIHALDKYAVWSSAASPIAVYYPGEMLLIKAEGLAQANDLPGALAEVDSVRTKCSPAFPGQPDACLTAYPGIFTTQAAALAEIYKQRRFELYSTGLRWEDLRRLGQVGPNQPAKRCWLVYPLSEKSTNPNVPADAPATGSC